MNEKLLEMTEQIKPCDTDSPYIFISYSSKDSEKVFRDVLEFQKRGYNLWIDVKNVNKTLKSWKDSAVLAVADYSCSFLIFYVSENSITSPSCFEEVLETKSERTRKAHYGEIKKLFIDVDTIIDIKKKAEEIATTIKKSHLSKDEKRQKTETLSSFMSDIFTNGNETPRALSDNNPARTTNYYNEIIKFFPEDTKNQPVSEDSAGEVSSSSGKSSETDASFTSADSQIPRSSNPPLPRKKIKYKSGSVYDGETKNGKRHGYGILKLSSGQVYEGHFVNDKYHGYGIYTFPDGKYYKGDFRDNTYDGKGEFHFANGDVFVGHYKSGKREGEGKLTYASGRIATLEGTFSNGKIIKGKRIYRNGDVYEGEFENGRETVNGVYTFASGSSGTAAGDEIKAKSEARAPEDRLNGFASKTFEDGSILEGNFVDGRLEGKGKYEAHRNGEVIGTYEGDFKRGAYNGWGTFTFADGRLYKGGFVMNLAHGHGSIIIPKGSVIDGKYYATDKIRQGDFINGKFGGEFFEIPHP